MNCLCNHGSIRVPQLTEFVLGKFVYWSVKDFENLDTQ